MRAPRRTGFKADFLVALALALTSPTPGHAAAAPASYLAQFKLELHKGEAAPLARLRIVQSEAALKRLRFDMPDTRFSDIVADGTLTRRDGVVTWDVPPRGGELRYRVTLGHQRNGKGYDALLTDSWAIFRGEDVFPAADATHRTGTRSRSELILDLPQGWSSATPFVEDASGHLAIVNPDRSFVRPVGWLLLGKIGARMDVIGATTVRIAAPLGQGAERLPMLALMRWTLPVLAAEIPEMPNYLLVVAGADPMWRGGLSAPNSLFLHSGLPLISENGTSTLVHELVHVLAPVPAAADQDWIDEGLAEYLGLAVLLKSDTISRERFNHAVETFRKRGSGVRSVVTRNASGEVKARAVAIFYDLDQELQRRSNGQSNLFELTRRMMREPRPIDAQRLRELAAELVGGSPVTALSPARVPGTR